MSPSLLNPSEQRLLATRQEANLQCPIFSSTFSNTTITIVSLVSHDPETSPFAAVVASSGPMAKTNPFRFSTKWWDDESGLGWWGFRYYDPGTGRWTGRDPIIELGSSAWRAIRTRQLQLRDEKLGRLWRILSSVYGSAAFDRNAMRNRNTLLLDTEPAIAVDELQRMERDLGVNLYLLCRNDAVLGLDPTGLGPIDAVVGRFIGGIAGGVTAAELVVPLAVCALLNPGETADVSTPGTIALSHYAAVILGEGYIVVWRIKRYSDRCLNCDMKQVVIYVGDRWET